MELWFRYWCGETERITEDHWSLLSGDTTAGDMQNRHGENCPQCQKILMAQYN